jgi:hypothetical protein
MCKLSVFVYFEDTYRLINSILEEYDIFPSQQNICKFLSTLSTQVLTAVLEGGIGKASNVMRNWDFM